MRFLVKVHGNRGYNQKEKRKKKKKRSLASSFVELGICIKEGGGGVLSQKDKFFLAKCSQDEKVLYRIQEKNLIAVVD